KILALLQRLEVCFLPDVLSVLVALGQDFAQERHRLLAIALHILLALKLRDYPFASSHGNAPTQDASREVGCLPRVAKDPGKGNGGRGGGGMLAQLQVGSRQFPVLIPKCLQVVGVIWVWVEGSSEVA